LIRPPEIPELRVNVSMRRVVKRPRIVYALAVPAFDLIGNYGGLFQANSVQQCRDLCRCRRAGQSFIGNSSDDLVAERTVRLYRDCESDRDDKCEE
jgi:hypothetical protein